MESILTSIKKLLGIAEDYTHFDADIIMHINTVLMDLNGLGVGPSTGFVIEDSTKTWTDFISNPKDLQAIKSYIYLRVKLLFDSSTLNSSTISSMERQIEKFEWLLTVAAENSKSGIIDENVSEEIRALIAELESENLTLKETNAKLESSNTAYKEANVTLNTKVSTLERTNSNLQVRVDTLEGLSSELQVSVDNLENENSGLRTTVADLEQDKAELTASNEALQDENAQLEINNAELTANNEALQDEKTELENVIEESGIVNADGSVKEKIEQLIEKAKTGGKDYADIIYNDDDTVTLVETNGTEHTISCVFDNNRIISMTYDGTEVAVVYNGDELVSVGETEVDVANVTLDNSLGVLIDESKVLDSTDGTVEDKVEMLTHYVYCFKKVFSLSYYNIKSIEHIDFYIDFVVQQVDFQYAGNLKTVVGVDVSKLTTCRYMFNGCQNLVSIQRPFDMSKHNAWHMTAMFDGCSSLVDVCFVTESIKESIKIPSAVLSDESIQSIIDGLATVETTQKLTLDSSVGASLTNEQLLTIASKNWEVG